MTVLVFGLVVLAPRAGQSKTLDFFIYNDTYARNIEHTGIDKINEGRTFIGDITKSFFRYRLKRGMMIEAGALLNIPFGDDDRVDTTDPIIAFHYEFKPGMRITAGTLDRNHPLLDAIFNNDILQYTDPIEQGFQFKIKKKHWLTDTWIDWEQRELINRREKFNVGGFYQFRLKGFSLDTQVYWVHFGGQRNSGGGADNNLSSAIGGGYSLYPKEKNPRLWFFDRLGFDIHYIHVKNEPSGGVPFSKGSGVLTKVFAEIWGTYIQFLVWEGGSQRFKTRKGDPLYKADDYQEIWIQKTFPLAQNVGLTAGFKGQYVEGKFVHEDLISVKWQLDFPVLSDYFKKLSARDRHSRQILQPNRIARRR